MKILTGIDIIEVNRIKKCIEKHGEKFLNRIYTVSEIEYCESKGKQKYQSYAARFAAKEAGYKAVSEYIKGNYSWKDFEVVNMPEGKPSLKINLEISEINQIDISLSHLNDLAVANVTILVD